MRALFRRTLSVASFIMAALSVPAMAGEVKELRGPRLDCIYDIRSGDALPEGIHLGRLPGQLLIERCDTLWLMLKLPGGAFRAVALPPRMVPKFRAKNRPFAIPDARVTYGKRNIRSAWLTRPNRRYAHAALGDDIQAGGLAVKNRNGRRIEAILPQDQVFEDRMARLADLDGDETTDEIVVVQTHVNKGAALAIYALKGRGREERLELLAKTPFIGRANRWLNPAVAADLDGDGRREIAWVETPHLKGILRVARLERFGATWRLREIASLPGFSNHEYGSRIMQQAVALDWNADGRPDIVLPSIRRDELAVVSLTHSGEMRVIDRMPIDGRITSQILTGDLDADGRGEVYLVVDHQRLLMFTPPPVTLPGKRARTP